MPTAEQRYEKIYRKIDRAILGSLSDGDSIIAAFLATHVLRERLRRTLKEKLNMPEAEVRAFELRFDAGIGPRLIV